MSIDQNKIFISQLNVAINPHPDGIYYKIFHESFIRVNIANYRGSDCLVIGEISKLEYSDYFYGTIYMFTNIEIEDNWLNLEKKQFASDAEKNLINIPDVLKPNARKFNFCFGLKNHRLYIEIVNEKRQSINPNSFAKALKNLLRSNLLEDHNLFITVLPTKATVDRIFNIPILRTLKLETKIPNGDQSDEVLKIEEEFNSGNIAKESRSYTAKPKKSLKISSDLEKRIKFSAENGYVEASGRNENGVRENISTRDTPAKFEIEIRPFEKFVDAINRIFGKA